MNNEFIKQYENLIYSMFRYFEYYPYKEDLFQQGVIGLMKAYENYDPNMNVKFSTFAYSHIWGEMNKLVAEDKTMKVSRNIRKLHLRIERTMIVLAQTYGREPSVDELVDYLGVTPYEIREALMSRQPTRSIDEPICMDGKEMSLHETIADKRETHIDELLTLKEQLQQLTDEEKRLIEARYMEDMTQSEVSKILGMSQVQVSRKEDKIKCKMRTGLLN